MLIICNIVTYRELELKLQVHPFVISGVKLVNNLAKEILICRTFRSLIIAIKEFHL